MARTKRIDPLSDVNLPIGLRGIVPDLLDHDRAPLLSRVPIGYFEADRPNPNEHPRKRNNTGGPMRYWAD